MKNYNLYYTDKHSISSFINANSISDSSSLLIQVFTSQNNVTYISKILDDLLCYFPLSKIIGTTTDGEIKDGYVSENKTVISFTKFASTSINIMAIEHIDRGFQTGKRVAKALLKKDTKAMISFATCYNTSGEEYLDGISSVNDTIIVAGGIASHNQQTTDTFVFTKEKIISSGIVAISLESDTLHVHNNYSYNWSKIGLELVINKVVDNRVYEIDNKTAYDVYVHYLGHEIAENLPRSGTEFPLIISRDGFSISRAVTEVHSDGSLSFAGDFHIGDIVQFGYGDIKQIHKKSIDISKQVLKKPAEVIFIYSCMARRHYLNEDIENETIPLSQIASTSGFFTHGEFYTEKRREFLNQTMTLLALSEVKSTKNVKNIAKRSKNFSNQALSINALAKLINVVSEEVDIQKKELLRQKNLYEKFFEEAADGIMILKEDTIVQCNERAYKMLGYTSKEGLLNKHPSEISPEFQPDGELSLTKAKKMMQKAIKENLHQFEWIHLNVDKKPLWMDIKLSYLVIENEEYIYATWRDIQKKKELEDKLLAQKESLFIQANYDSLTGLTNRNLFYDKLQRGIEKAERNKSKIALFFIDLDIFKDVNDSLGHNIGDELLKHVAQRLTQSTRKTDTVSRIGGDEFTVIIEDIEDTGAIVDIATLLREKVSKSYEIDEHIINTSCSIGISIYPDDTSELNHLVKYADTAMYKAKSEGRNKQWFYSNEMTQIVSNRMKVDNEIREGLLKNHFEAYYQIQIDAKEQKIIGAEALIRWNHKDKGLVFPDEFIPIAQKSDLIIKIDDWMMEASMKMFAKLYKQNLNPGILSLNLSIKQLESSNYVAKLTNMMDKYSFKAEWLKLEILESQIMKRVKENIEKLNEISALGISIAMDDFGTGESSFTYLRKFPISEIKIDKSFVMNMNEEKGNKEIVKAIIALGNALNLNVLAEGVESEEDKKYLLENDCHLMQGYHFSKPIQANNLIEALKK